MSQLHEIVIGFPINFFILFDIFDLVTGIFLCFFVRKENIKYISSVVGIYWGVILGGIFGAWIDSENVYVLYLGALIVVFILIVIMKILRNGYKFMIGMVSGFKVVFIMGTMFFRFTSPDYPESVEERNCFLVALLLGILFGIFISFLKEEYEIVFGGICAFIGATQIVGILAWDPRPAFIISGEWNHFFLPLLKVVFYDDMMVFLGLIFLVAGIGFLVQIKRRKRRGKITGWSKDFVS